MGVRLGFSKSTDVRRPDNPAVGIFVGLLEGLGRLGVLELDVLFEEHGGLHVAEAAHQGVVAQPDLGLGLEEVPGALGQAAVAPLEETQRGRERGRKGSGPFANRPNAFNSFEHLRIECALTRRQEFWIP